MSYEYFSSAKQRKIVAVEFGDRIFSHARYILAKKFKLATKSARIACLIVVNDTKINFGFQQTKRLATKHHQNWPFKRNFRYGPKETQKN